MDGGKAAPDKRQTKFLNRASAETGIKFQKFHGFINKDDPFIPKAWGSVKKLIRGPEARSLTALNI